MSGDDGAEVAVGLLAGFVPGSRVAGYLIEAQIGAGGMAVVFRATDERLGRRVALKVLAPALAHDPVFRERFIRESRSAAAVDDPHIIPVYEAGEAEGVLFIAMRLVPGRDVRTLLHQEGPLPADRVAAIISQVASALDAAHAAGLVHRDVKPANMLVDTRRGRPDHVYLSDFGLSKGTLSTTGLTGSGIFLGTPSYTAPEQIQGRAVDGRTDQYALACAAFELLVGEPPFERDQGMAVIWAHLSEPPPSPRSRRAEFPAAIDSVFARALSKAPERRYPTCVDFADDMRAALRLMPYDSGPRTIPGPGHPATLAATSLPGLGHQVLTGQPGSSWDDDQDADAGEPTVTSARAVLATPPRAPNETAPDGAEDDGHNAIGVAFTPDGSAYAVACRDSIWICDTATGDVLADLSENLSGSGATAIACSPDGALVAVGTGTGDALLLDPADQAKARRITYPSLAMANSVVFSPGGDTLACGDDNGSTYLWDIRTLAVSGVLNDPESRGVFAVAFSPEGDTLAAGDGNGCAYLWDVRTKQVTGTLQEESGAGDVFSLAFTPDGSVLATAHNDGAVRLWASDTGEQISCLTRKSLGGNSVLAIAFNPFGQHLAAGYSSGRTCLWDIERGRLILTLGKHQQSSVYAIAFGPDGETVLTGHSDGTTILWDIVTGQFIRHRTTIRR